MAQRLNAINVGYRPLNPADDVAGLAGQRQAVTEFNAKSADMARLSQQQNARASLALQAHQMAQQSMQAAVTASNNMEKAKMQIKMQQAQLAQKAETDAAHIGMAQRMMPLEMEAMALANEAQEIQNEFAGENMALSNDNLRASNAIKRQEFKDMLGENAEASKVDDALAVARKAVRDGGTVDDVPRPKFEHKASEVAYDKGMSEIARTTQAEKNELQANQLNASIMKLSPNRRGAWEPGSKFMTPGVNPVPTEEGEIAVKRAALWEALLPNDAEKQKFWDDAKGSRKWGEIVNGAYIPNEAGLTELRATRAATKIPTYSSNLIESGKELPRNQFMAKAYNLIENEYRKEEGVPTGDLKPQQKAEVMSKTLKQFGQNAQGLDKYGEQLANATAPLYIYDPEIGYNVALSQYDVDGDLDITEEEITNYRLALTQGGETADRRSWGAVLGQDENKVELNAALVPGMTDDKTNVSYPQGEGFEKFNERWDSDDWDDGFYAHKGDHVKRWERDGISEEDRKDYVTYAIENSRINGLTESGGDSNKEVLKKDVFQGMKKHLQLDTLTKDLGGILKFTNMPWLGDRGVTGPLSGKHRSDKEIRAQEGEWAEARQANEIVTSEVYKSKSIKKQMEKPLSEWQDGDVIYLPLEKQNWSDFGGPNAQGTGLFGGRFLGKAHWGEGHAPAGRPHFKEGGANMYKVVLNGREHNFKDLHKVLGKFIKVGPELDRLITNINK